jgi:uncharacterized protein (TIGR02172 family)
MNITYRVDKDIIYIEMAGRVDASNASVVEEKILSIKEQNPGKHSVIDADKLEYISSAGLRVILRLRKEEPKLAIINVSSEVYEIFDMTGFTDMITIEKAYSKISVDGCEFIAKGANGAVYRYDNETIVKTYFEKDSLPEIKQERENARRAFVLGINTAIPYGIVRVGDGYGTVTELLNAVSISKLIKDDPENLTTAAKYYIDMLKTIHSIDIEDNVVPDMKEIALSWADFVSDHIPSNQAEKLHRLIEAVPKVNKLMHGDYNSNNIMIQNGEAILIDMDTLCMGHPVFELGSMFNAFVGFSELNHQNMINFFGYSYETAGKFWDLTLKMYFDTTDESLCQKYADKAMIIGYTRMLRRAIRRPNEADSAAIIEHCKKMLEILLDRVDDLNF